MNETLEALQELLDGVTVYSDYLASLCPYHEDSRPSFMVHADRYQCLSCGANGTTQSLLQTLSNAVPVHTPTTQFHNPFTYWLKQDGFVDKILIRAWQTLVTHPYMGSYLHGRGISAENCKKYGIGYRENWYTFPIKNMKNTIVGAVARAGEGNDSPAKYVVPANQNPNLLYIPSIKLIEQQRKIYLTFGIIDALSLAVCGVAAVSTTNGKRVTATALNEFRKCIVILPDRGEEVDGAKLAGWLGWRGKAKYLDYPEGCKDCNDVLKLYGPSKLLKLLE